MFWLKLFSVVAMVLSQLPSGLQMGQTTPQSSTGTPLDLREFRLNTGDIIKGDIASANEDGLVVKLDVGGFSNRVPWGKFTQETLRKLLNNNRETARFVLPFIEIPAEVKAKNRVQRARQKTAFTPKPVERVELPAEKPGLVATVSTPFNLAILALFYLANLYAAYEIAQYRNRPTPLVCGVSALLPVVGPILFLSLPPRTEWTEEAGPADASLPGGKITGPVPAHAAKSSLSMSKGHATGAPTATVQPALYTRNDTTFDRRFFETKFSGFFRVVLGEAEKDYIIVVKTVRDEYMAKRIARITTNELHLQLLHGGGAEKSVNFGEIIQVQLRHKDAKA